MRRRYLGLATVVVAFAMVSGTAIAVEDDDTTLVLPPAPSSAEIVAAEKKVADQMGEDVPAAAPREAPAEPEMSWDFVPFIEQDPLKDSVMARGDYRAEDTGMDSLRRNTVGLKLRLQF